MSSDYRICRFKDISFVVDEICDKDVFLPHCEEGEQYVSLVYKSSKLLVSVKNVFSFFSDESGIDLKKSWNSLKSGQMLYPGKTAESTFYFERVGSYYVLTSENNGNLVLYVPKDSFFKCFDLEKELKSRISLFSLSSVLLVLSLLIGFIGNKLSDPDVNFFYNLYTLVQYCSFEFNPMEEDFNVLTSIAQWACPLSWLFFAASCLVSLKKWFNDLLLRFDMKKSGVAVQGDSVYCELLARIVGPDAVYDKDNPLTLKANEQYILFDTNDRLFAFLNKNRTSLRNKNIHIVSESLRPTSTENNDIDLVYLPERVAQWFWLENTLTYVPQTTVRIAIIGFGHYGQALLVSALRQQVFPDDMIIEYHVYPTDDTVNDFLSEYWNISCIATLQNTGEAISIEKEKDVIVFHDVASWDRGEYSIKDIPFDKIIISPDKDDDSISIMHRMKRIGEFENIFVRFSDLTPDAGLVYSTSEENENKWYGSLSSILSKDDVRGRWIKKTSRLVAQSYDLVFTKNDFSSLKDADDLLNDNWKKLITKHKRANINSALSIPAKESILSYLKIRDRAQLLEVMAYSFLKLSNKYPSWESIPDDISIALKNFVRFFFDSEVKSIDGFQKLLESVLNEDRTVLEEESNLLLEVEHTRWCRDYYLDNWRYGEKKDTFRRLHPDLVSNEKLEKDKEKDWVPYMAILRNSECDF